ncbi:PML-RARA-regulated adapter molecule 1 isoform 3-T3 [Acridotheres tristis]
MWICQSSEQVHILGHLSVLPQNHQGVLSWISLNQAVLQQCPHGSHCRMLQVARGMKMRYMMMLSPLGGPGEAQAFCCLLCPSCQCIPAPEEVFTPHGILTAAPLPGFGFTGGNAVPASNRITLLAATQRESQISHKMNTMTLKACKKEDKMDREFQKKFKFEGSINVLTRMMVDPAATEKRGGAKNLPLRRGEILDVIQFTNQEQILCRNSQRRYGYVPRAVMLPLDTDIYDDVEING